VDSPTWRFGQFSIAPGEKLLRRAGQPVSLPPKAVETLLVLIESAGRVVGKEELLRKVWPDVAVEENNLTQQISILRKTFDEEGPTWIQTVPKRGYRFAPPVETQTPLRRKRTAFAASAVAAIVVLIAIGLFATRPEAVHSVAVLPLQPLSPNDELSAVGLGITDAVVQRLAYSGEVEVQPMSAVRRYLANNPDPLAAGRELNVDAVLAGTIQRAGDRYRITMELVDVRTNRSRWSGKIEESAADVFRLQDMVAEATLRSLPSKADTAAASGPRRRIPAPAAHEAFLKGRYYWSRRTDGDVERAIQEFERAVSIDDSYANAWAGLASAINLQSLHFISEPEPSFARSRSAARQALLLDPDSAEAHAALGFITFYYDWKWQDAETSFRRAIALDPANGNYRQLLSNLLVANGRFDEAIAQMDEAIRADPASLMVRAVTGRQYYLARRYGEAVAVLQKALDMDSSFHAARGVLGSTLSEIGRFEEARQILEELAKSGQSQAYIHAAYAAAKAGDAEGARQHMRQAEESASNGAFHHYDKAAVHVALGEPDLAFRELDHAIRKRYSGMVWLKVDPRLDPIRSDPRFAMCLSRVGFQPGP
jgi:DNA-binding winged helix-turn-helix (wHTH) protein/TolB-like protein/Tfp pilus assembly protein PilF